MKIRKSSRITAIVLALMMIVPLISVPAFAADKVDATKATPIASDDFESYADGTQALGNALLQGPTNAIITNFGGSNVIKYDLTVDQTRVDGEYWIKGSKTGNDTWYLAEIDWNLLDFDENDEVVYGGTVKIDGALCYFKQAWLNDDNATIACKLYSDEAYTLENTAQTFHLCTAGVRNARQGHASTGKSLDSNLKAASGVAGNYLVFSADYYFASNIANRAFDFRIRTNQGNVHIGNFTPTNSGVTVDLHNDLKDGAIYNPGYTVAKDAWFNVTFIVDCTAGNGVTKITLYVNGNLAGYGEQKITDWTNLHAEQPWNLGHPQRGASVSTYKGNYYVDNCAIYNTADVIPSDWEEYDPNKILNQNFNATTDFPSDIAWAGSNKEIVADGANNYLKLDAGIAGNQDKAISLTTGKVEGGIVQIDVDYYIPSTAQYGFQHQFGEMYAKGSATFGGEASESQARYTWVDLFFVRANGGKAWINQVGDASALAKEKTVIYDSALPVNEFFTISTIINMTTGEFMVFVNGEIAAKSFLFRTNNFLTDCYFNNSKALVSKINKPGTAGLTTMSGALSIDNILVKKIDAMPVIKFTTNEDFEGYVAGTHAEAPSNKPTVAPSTATYAQFMGSQVVSISMLGATEATTLDVPFVGTNSRSYDLTVVVDSWDETQEITVELLSDLTFTGSINNPANDKPIYYAFDGTTAYVYNANGNALAADGSNIGSFKLEKHVIGDANYNGMFRAMCGGTDSNIDKNFRVKHIPLDVAGTYVLSADYFIANDASGEIQSQIYNEPNNKWLDLYRIDLTTKVFNALNGATAGGENSLPLLVDEWNTVTMIVTVADDLSFSADIYLNGVYSHTKAHDYAINANSWILAKIGKPSIAQAQKMAGYIYLDNVKVNADEYDANKAMTIDASAVAGFDIDGKTGIINVSNSAELKLYASDVTVIDANFVATRMLSGVIATENVASIRLGAPTGLRFATTIYEGRIQQLIDMGVVKSYNHGTLIAPTDYLAEKELTFENFIEKETMLNVKSTNGEYYDIDGNEFSTHFVGSIVNIKEANYDREFTGRGYLQVTLANGYVLTIYSATTKSISVADQAQLLIDAGAYAEDSAEYEILAGFAAANN